jgi:ribosomal protein S18 acetylase RimI-like enzyme
MKYLKKFELLFSLKTFPGSIDDMDYCKYTFIKDGEEVGYIIIDYRMETKEVYLSSFTIDEKYRSKGLGRKYLTDILKQLSLKKKVKWVSLSVNKSNKALELYKSLGFDLPENIEGSPNFKYDNNRNLYLIKRNV